MSIRSRSGVLVSGFRVHVLEGRKRKSLNARNDEKKTSFLRPRITVFPTYPSWGVGRVFSGSVVPIFPFRRGRDVETVEGAFGVVLE